MIPPPGAGAAPVRRQAPLPLERLKGAGQQPRRELARHANQPLQTGCCPAPGGGMIPLPGARGGKTKDNYWTATRQLVSNALGFACGEARRVVG